MISEICAYLKNWFDVDEFHNKLPRVEGTFTIENGNLPQLAELLIANQYFYIYGSYFNDGVHQYTDKLKLEDETFTGLVQSMRPDPDFLKVCGDIETWANKYSAADSAAMSPFNSESFGGYSYNKSSGTNADGGMSANDPISAFSARLNRWRKI